jgi:hypothetical protein
MNFRTRVHDKGNDTVSEVTECDEALFGLIMRSAEQCNRMRIIEDKDCGLKPDLVPFQIECILLFVPLKAHRGTTLESSRCTYTCQYIASSLWQKISCRHNSFVRDPGHTEHSVLHYFRPSSLCFCAGANSSPGSQAGAAGALAALRART